MSRWLHALIASIFTATLVVMAPATAEPANEFPVPAAGEAAQTSGIVASPTARTASRQEQPGTWMRSLKDMLRDQPVSVSAGVDGTFLLHVRGADLRTPASNEKLLLSMALFDHFDPATRIPTTAKTGSRVLRGVVTGNLWIVGAGDPEIRDRDMSRLATAVVAAGIKRVRGSVIGDTRPFAHDDFATGWKSYFPKSVMPPPTALTFDANVDADGEIVHDPERRAAASLTRALRKNGVRVGGAPRMGRPSGKLRDMAAIASARLRAIVTRMDDDSINFDAEVLGKYLGQSVRGAPGTIAKGAAAIHAYASARDVDVTVYDSSGLSYANRVTTDGILQLLWDADAQTWLPRLMSALPKGGQGTLQGRLTGVTVRAKTGTLDGISALSGWVWLERSSAWAEFSILSRGLSKSDAMAIENTVVRTLAKKATVP
ncbi:MAG: D-alanyl-D-alanine carboxypeptidase [Actinomycetota bacterium]|nr:D-alanyl-D-alanine carboxypeptidase [Actinomycetota bacterium]